MSQSGLATGASPAVDDRREAPRLTLLLRPAKLVCSGGEYLCILRDLAAGGTRLRLFHALPSDRFITLETTTGDRFEVEKVWERDGEAGFAFVHQTDLELLLEERGRFPKRQLRVSLDIPVRITVAGARYETQLVSLSQKGGRIRHEARLATDQRVHLEGRGLPPLDAKVRWSRNGEAGLVFEQTFKLDELARVLLQMQPIPRAAPPEEEGGFAIVGLG